MLGIKELDLSRVIFIWYEHLCAYFALTLTVTLAYLGEYLSKWKCFRGEWGAFIISSGLFRSSLCKRRRTEGNCYKVRKFRDYLFGFFRSSYENGWLISQNKAMYFVHILCPTHISYLFHWKLCVSLTTTPFLILTYRSRPLGRILFVYCVVSIEIMLQAWRAGVRIYHGQEILLFSKSSIPALGLTPCHDQDLPGYFPGGKAAGAWCYSLLNNWLSLMSVRVYWCNHQLIWCVLGYEALYVIGCSTVDLPVYIVVYIIICI